MLDVLVERRPHELRAAWGEAFARGKSWRRLLGEGLGLPHPAIRDKVLRLVGSAHEVIPDLKLWFVPETAAYDADLDVVRSFALAGGEGVSCSVTNDALTAIGSSQTLDRGNILAAFHRHRPKI